MNTLYLYLPLGAGVLSVLFALGKAIWVKRQDPGEKRLQEIGSAIRKGAMAFLAREYKVLAIIVAAVAVMLFLSESGAARFVALSFVSGAVLSALAGFIGMNAATRANTRTANAARSGLVPSLNIAFQGGSVMGLSVVGLGLAGLSALTILYMNLFVPETLAAAEQVGLLSTMVLPMISGYSLGASSVALFARVGGGIFTKAADVGADLVGKVEAGIPEDDPRNPAVIADNVGDNVGDVAGLGSDLCESYIGSIIGAMVLGGAAGSVELVVFPLLIAGAGVLVSIISTFIVRTREGGNPQTALNIGTFGAAIITAALAFPLIRFVAPETFRIGGTVYESYGIFVALIGGLIGGILVGIITEYYTGDGKKPVLDIARSSNTGAATNIISGLGLGMQSTAMPIVLLGVAIWLAYFMAGLYGIAVASLGMLATTGVQLSVDAYGPIADNAGGLAEMAEM
ncbi:MAG: sodium/proton-translocating pyrophosphatase, partial [Spirochaetales bacterium]|nr:sodium/proton-translocating pyrophosphatase [Spirochaetales bacterium]MCF7938474.1 sodium/proton-translocating pyrophosphatase [Spirochaetales bacterium]